MMKTYLALLSLAMSAQAETCSHPGTNLGKGADRAQNTWVTTATKEEVLACMTDAQVACQITDTKDRHYHKINICHKKVRKTLSVGFASVGNRNHGGHWDNHLEDYFPSQQADGSCMCEASKAELLAELAEEETACQDVADENNLLLCANGALGLKAKFDWDIAQALVAEGEYYFPRGDCQCADNFSHEVSCDYKYVVHNADVYRCLSADRCSMSDPNDRSIWHAETVSIPQATYDLPEEHHWPSAQLETSDGSWRLHENGIYFIQNNDTAGLMRYHYRFPRCYYREADVDGTWESELAI